MDKKKIISMTIVICLIIIGLLFWTININYAKEKRARVITYSDIKNERIQKTNMKDKIIKENNTERTLKYKESKLGVDRYISEEGFEYHFDDNKLVGFKKFYDKDISTKKISDKEAEKIAEEFGEKTIENFSKYKFSSNNYNDLGLHMIEYTYIMQGYNTIDTISVWVNDFREIEYFQAYYQNIFDKYEDINIDKEAIKKTVEDEIKNEYGNKLANYTIRGMTLSIINDKCVMLIGVDIDCKTEYKDDNGEIVILTSVETIMYEL